MHLPQVPGLLDQILVHGLALAPRACPPVSNRPLVNPKRRHNRLQGTPMGEQGHDDHHGLCRGAQPIEDGVFAGAEGFVTRVTDEPLFLLRMDTDIALARLASGRTVPIGAECGCGVHDGPPGVVWKHAKRSIFGPPFSLQVRFTTVKCRATPYIYTSTNGCFDGLSRTGYNHAKEPLHGQYPLAAFKRPYR